MSFAPAMAMRRFPLRLATAFASVLFATPGLAQIYTDPVTLERAIATRGASSVVAELFAQPQAWDYVLKRIESGDKRWIDVAGRLAQATDAGSAETLDISLFYALKPAPVDVLRITSISRIASVCSANFTIDDNVKNVVPFLRDRIHALNSVAQADLLDKRNACLSGLTDAERFFSQHPP